MKKPLFKTTAIIWSKTDPRNVMELSTLAKKAETGDCYSEVTVQVDEPTEDQDWYGTDFFGSVDEDEEVPDSDKGMAAMLRRAAAALETPGDLTDEERKHIIEDLLDSADDYHEEDPDPDEVINVKLTEKGKGEPLG